ncbi:MAG: DNA repair and recombination protein RadB [Thermoplasmata archaeon]|nr:DNA repair and recombination protein RadB [Thermoplasmata archaeon]MCI4338684.1 DNA repair and recombination protein RadB [Thermoplasmata archaeon]MCI4341642.1 DNA repair and recombination protein RadB [Thermoplasmata archaeon]
MSPTATPAEGAGPTRLPTGVPALDRLLGGGYDTDGLTMLYGEGGSGKTVLCLAAATQVAREGRHVLYIDTEGVSPERAAAGSGDGASALLRRWLLASPRSLEEQGRAVRTGCALVREGRRPFGLVVLDSATLYYRLALGTPEEDEARSELLHELAELLATAIHAEVPVLLTNQVWHNVTTGVTEPLGGSFLIHVAKTVLRLERPAPDRRRAVLVKHRSRPEGSAEFRITGTGIEGLPSEL